MRYSPYGLATVTIALALSSTPAPADVFLTETMSISGTVEPPLGVHTAPTTVDTSQFAAFNPALGTLLSISATLSGTLNYTGSGIPADEGTSLELQEDPVVSKVCTSGIDDCIFIPALGSGIPFSFALSGMTDPTVLSNYSGTGLRDFGVYDFAGNLTDLVTLDGEGTVTFEYASAIPEPSGFDLMVVGMIGVVALRRSMRRHQTVVKASPCSSSQ
jgi:hypothetical protein